MTEKSRAQELTEKREFWKELIHHWQESGLTQTDYCRTHNLTTHQFSYWKKKIIKPPEPSVSLVQVNMNPAFSAMPGSPLRLVINDQYRIEVDRDFDPVALNQLLATLRQL